MARVSRKLTVDFTPEALQDLVQIWEWNADHRGKEHASRYVYFLRSETAELAEQTNPGRVIPNRDTYRYATLRWSSQGHGHVVVFEILGAVLRVLRYFHTAQDWENKLEG